MSSRSLIASGVLALAFGGAGCPLLRDKERKAHEREVALTDSLRKDLNSAATTA